MVFASEESCVFVWYTIQANSREFTFSFYVLRIKMNNCCFVFLFCLCFTGIIMGGFIKIIEFQELANWKVWLDFLFFLFKSQQHAVSTNKHSCSQIVSSGARSVYSLYLHVSLKKSFPHCSNINHYDL